jgi:hypothetical protein
MREREFEILEQRRLNKAIEAEKLKMKIFPKKPEIQNQVQQKIQEKSVHREVQSPPQSLPISREQIMQKSILIQNIKPTVQEIPAANISPAQNIALEPGEINFGKIIALARDPLVTYIECAGESKNIVIKKTGQTFKTSLTLAKEEIIAIIKDFSEKTRIPLVEGMLNARYQNLEISAVVSELIPPSFIIRKDIIQNQLNIIKQRPRYLARPNY